MDITTPLGWVLAAVLIVISIGFDKLSNFYDVSSIEIVGRRHDCGVDCVLSAQHAQEHPEAYRRPDEGK